MKKEIQTKKIKVKIKTENENAMEDIENVIKGLKIKEKVSTIMKIKKEK